MGFTHFQLNRPPADWRLRLEVSSCPSTHTGVDSGPNNADLNLDTTFGNLYSVGGGFKQQIYIDDPYTGTDTTKVRLYYPEFTIAEEVSIAGVATPKSRVQIYGAYVLSDCDSWALYFDYLRWWVNDAEILLSGHYILPEVPGIPYVHSGGAYDGRFNSSLVSAFCETVPLAFGNVNCGPSEDPFYRSIAVAALGGWAKASGTSWLSQGILIDGSVAPPSVTCACPFALPSISGSNTDNVVVTADSVSDRITYNLIPPITCESDTMPPGPPHTFDPTWRSQWARLIRQSQVTIQSVYGLPKVTRRAGQSGCSSSKVPMIGDEVATTTLEASCYAEYKREVTYHTQDFHCTPDETDPGLPYGEVRCRPFVACTYQARTKISWPEVPTCDEPALAQTPHNTSDFLGRMTRVATRDDQLWLLRADAGSPRSGWQHELYWGANVETPRGMWNQEFLYELVYRDSSDGNVYWTRSTDDCKTFETPVQLFMAAKYPHPFHDSRYAGFACWKSGNIYLRIRKPSENTPGAEFFIKDALGIAIDFEDTAFGITVPPIGPNPWILSAVAYGDTEPSEWESTDNGLSWEAV